MRGHAVHIPEQNARLLRYLIEKAGRLATREELQSFLWPENAPYDSQQAINKAISQLRTALGDHSVKSASRYIETIPRRGYRFCAEFQFVTPPVVALAPATVGLALAPEASEPEVAEVLAAKISMALEHQPAIVVSATGNRLSRRKISLVTGVILGLGLAIFLLAGKLQRQPVPVSPAFRTIGIPPMEAVGPNANMLAESFRLDLTESLAQLPQLRVLSAHAFLSAPRDKGDVSELARTQSADLLLPGRFEVKDGRYFVEFELVRNADSSHLAAFHYEGTPEQVRGMLTKIQEDVFARLKLTSAGDAPPHTTTNPEAYQSYVQGRHYLVERTDDALNKSIAQFKHATDLDPKFAKAYSGMASAYMVLAAHRSFPAGYQMARGLAQHALQLDASVAEAHALLGCIAMSKDWDTRTSENELQRAIELDPDEASFHIWMATTLNIQGRFKESLHQIDLAKQEDPYWPPVYQSEVLAAANAGQKKRVLDSAHTLLQLTPGWPIAHNDVGSAYWAIGRYSEAVSEWRTMYSLDNDQPGIRLEEDGLKALRSGGPAAYALVHLKNAKLVADTDQAFSPSAVAEWAAEAGEKDLALSTIQSMIQHRDPSSVSFDVDPAFVQLREDPRFTKMLAQSGLNFKR